MGRRFDPDRAHLVSENPSTTIKVVTSDIMHSAVFRRVSKLAALIGPAVTLTITPLWNYDPINPGKVLVLSVLAFTCFGYLIPSLGRIMEETGRPIWIVSAVFLLSLISSFIFSGAPFAQQFWGVFGRNTGILTYVSLTLTLLILVSLKDSEFYRRTLILLLVVGIVETGYATLQLLGLDPIAWSSYAAFGTLGNVNFLSGFLGISCSAMAVFCLSSGINWKVRLGLSLIVIWSLFVAYETDSIQGPIAFGGGVLIFILMKSATKGWKYLLPALTFSFATLIVLIFALFNRGPLASIVYQVTIIYRGDYMHAGLKMMLEKPFFGVGIDSYDDWYRYERGTISAFRTSFNRTANTAHNVAIDLGAGGGLPLLISYLLLMGLVLIAIYRGFKKGFFSEVTFIAATSAWFAYQVQAAVSINQIGVGVWGWILSGIIIGYSKISIGEKQDPKSNGSFMAKKKTKSKSIVQIPASSVVVGGLLACLGFALAFIPVKNDQEARFALNSRSLERILAVAKNPFTSSFLLSQAAEVTLNNNLNDEARSISQILIDRYPRNFYGWTLRLSSPIFSESERSDARLKIGEIDPNAYLCLNPGIPQNILDYLKELPLDQQVELLTGWGINEGSLQRGFSGLDQASVSLVNSKILSMCA